MFGLGRPTARKVVRRYVDRLNARDVDGIALLLHPHCRFIDSHGEWIEGREAIVAATRRFFAIERKFRLNLEAVVEHEGEVLLRGKASAERAEFRQDALWKARVEGGKIIFWQSFGPQSSPRLARILSAESVTAAPIEVVAGKPSPKTDTV